MREVVDNDDGPGCSHHSHAESLPRGIMTDTAPFSDRADAEGHQDAGARNWLSRRMCHDGPRPRLGPSWGQVGTNSLDLRGR
jgi:hypothetical protein